MLSNLINNAIETLPLKSNINGIIVIIDFFRSPDLIVEFYILQDKNDITNVSKKFQKRLLFDKKTKKQYFNLDNNKYFIKTKVV